ncbi:MAG: NAD(P)H-dependent oxidoreductase [Clostridia bacterium]|nr:NAD(P)H-dependent oxidoreductase [Clostridia bacterium]
MNILTIIGTAHRGNTRAIVDLFLKEFENKNNNFEEIILPNDFQNFCLGCANCILKGEEKCPHFNDVNKIVEKIEKADLIIIATPVFVGSCTSGLKALLDHLAYMWLVHRPKESMFNKVGLIITSAGGSGVKQTVKLLKSNFFYLGVPKIYNYGVTTMKMGGNYCDYKNKDKIKNQVNKKAKQIEKTLSKRKVGIKTKLFFNLFKMTQKNGWNKLDVKYWKDNGWLDGKKPY